MILLLAIEAPLNNTGIYDVVRGITLSASWRLVGISHLEGLTTIMDVASNIRLRLGPVVPNPIFNDVPVSSQFLSYCIIGHVCRFWGYQAPVSDLIFSENLFETKISRYYYLNATV